MLLPFPNEYHILGSFHNFHGLHEKPFSMMKKVLFVFSEYNQRWRYLSFYITTVFAHLNLVAVRNVLYLQIF